MCSSKKYPYSPHRRDWNFLGGGVEWGGGFCKAKNNIEMYEVNWNFQRGGGIPSTGRYGYFLELPVHNTKRLPMVS